MSVFVAAAACTCVEAAALAHRVLPTSMLRDYVYLIGLTILGNIALVGFFQLWDPAREPSRRRSLQRRAAARSQAVQPLAAATDSPHLREIMLMLKLIDARQEAMELRLESLQAELDADRVQAQRRKQQREARILPMAPAASAAPVGRAASVAVDASGIPSPVAEADGAMIRSLRPLLDELLLEQPAAASGPSATDPRAVHLAREDPDGPASILEAGARTDAARKAHFRAAARAAAAAEQAAHASPTLVPDETESALAKAAEEEAAAEAAARQRAAREARIKLARAKEKEESDWEVRRGGISFSP